MTNKTVILGAGLAGLSAAYHLEGNYEIFEKKQKIGGIAATEETNGFFFDYGIHAIHTKDCYVLKLLDNLLGENLQIKDRKALIYTHDKYIKYPFQANLYGLPTPVVKECLLEFIKNKYKNKTKRPKNYAEWLNSTYGKGISKHFMIPYSKKMWLLDPKDLTLEWVDVRFPKPTLEEVLDGTLNTQNQEFGPNAKFRYPLHNGMQAITNAFESKIKKINFNHEAMKIDVKRKKLYFKNSEETNYDKMVTTIPLPDLVKIIEKCPKKVQQAAEHLKWVSDFCVNLGINQTNLSESHWIYYVDKKFPFLRISMNHNFSPNMAPKGKSSIQAEVFYSKKNAIDKNAIVKDVIENLINLRFRGVHNFISS